MFKTEDDETQDEKQEQERDNLTDNEAHEVGEFDYLRDKMDNIVKMLETLTSQISALDSKYSDNIAQMVENGAVITDDTTDDAVIVPDDALENLDYTL